MHCIRSLHLSILVLFKNRNPCFHCICACRIEVVFIYKSTNKILVILDWVCGTYREIPPLCMHLIDIYIYMITETREITADNFLISYVHYLYISRIYPSTFNDHIEPKHCYGDREHQEFFKMRLCTNQASKRQFELLGIRSRTIKAQQNQRTTV